VSLRIGILIVLMWLPSVHAQRYALVIGNSNYGQEMGRLKNPVNDARDMAKLLINKGFKVTTVIDASKREMKTKISQFSQRLDKDSIGLFFFAGHGVQVNNNNYLVPIKAAIETEVDVEFEAINANYILHKMKESENKINIVILDACRNNPYASSFRSIGQRGLTRINPTEGTLVLYASSPGQVASDGAKRNGLFTQHLLQQISQSTYKIEDIFKSVARGVNKDSARKQLPWYEGMILGDFYFTQTKDQPIKLESSTPKVTKTPVTTQQADAYLIIATTPSNARVRILNITPKYRDGIKLKTGRYHIEVSAAGYRKQTQWLTLDAGNTQQQITLARLPKVSEQNNMKAQYNLGVKHQKGKDPTVDNHITQTDLAKLRQIESDKADFVKRTGGAKKYYKDHCADQLQFLKRTANQGQSIAQAILGGCFNFGAGVKKDAYEAVKWYRKAANQDNSNAQTNLGSMYEKGLGVSKDPYEAVKWYRKAANQGNPTAQYNLGVKYERGRGVRKDY